MCKGWEIAGQFLGFAGTLMLVIPQLRDFFLRVKRDRTGQLPIKGKLANAQQHFVDSFNQQINQPKPFDLTITLLGLLFIVASFLIGFIGAILGDGA